MSSPSSSGTSSKRKRASTLEKSGTKKRSTVDLQQPSSRDASGEDAADSAAQDVTGVARHKKNESLPSKRPRTRSFTADDTNGKINNAGGDEEGEEEDGVQLKRRTKSSSHKSHLDPKADSKAMPPPMKAGLQDPVGFKTNPPPTGRPVRIYADGVFDLFHLGFAFLFFSRIYLLTNLPGICVNWSKRRKLSQTYTLW